MREMLIIAGFAIITSSTVAIAQGACGSCWAFSSDAATDSRNAGSSKDSCSLKTLEGSYIYYSQGFTSANVPLAYAGMAAFDGKGHVIMYTKFADNTEAASRGSYRVWKNCAAEVVYDDNRKVTYFLDPSGERFVRVVTSGVVVASDAKRVSKKNLLAETPGSGSQFKF